VKKTALIIYIIYGLSIVALFILFLTPCKRSVKADGTEGQVITKNDEIDSILTNSTGTNTRIAFVNTDSILTNYYYYKKSIDKFEKQKEQAEKQFQSKYKNLEEDYKNYLAKINLGLMTEAEAEAQFSKKQRDLETYYNNLMESLMKNEEEVSVQLYDSIISHVERYNKNKGFHFIIAHSKGSNILFADPELDLTDEIIAELNKNQPESKGTKKGKK
jgi:outer membrane protein